MAGLWIPPEIELPSSGGGGATIGGDGIRSDEIEFRWIVTGKSGFTDAMAWAENKFPVVRQGRLRTRLDPRPMPSAPGCWEVVAAYANEGVTPDTMTEEEMFFGPLRPAELDCEIGTTTERVTQFYSDSFDPEALVKKFAREPETAANVPDYKGAVGVSNDRVEGVERHVPYVTWTESWQIHQRAIFENRPYRGKNDPRPIAERPQFEPSFFERLRAMAGTTNNNKWRDFPRGDALFLGARFRLRRTASMTVMSFAFAHRQGRKPKDDSLPGALRQHRIGDVKIDEYKPGFWHLDILYDTQSSGAGMVQRPRYVRMGPVGPESDFEALRVSSQAFPAIGLPDVKVQH